MIREWHIYKGYFQLSIKRWEDGKMEFNFQVRELNETLWDRSDIERLMQSLDGNLKGLMKEYEKAIQEALGKAKR